jgi:hypothetical protein
MSFGASCHEETHALHKFREEEWYPLHGAHLPVEEPSQHQQRTLANSLSVSRGGNAFQAAKQSHQIRNMNVFERTHGIFDLVARPLVGVPGH